MATITSTPTATSLSISGTSAKSGTISWSMPTVPNDATVTSRVLTGTVSISMSKGTCRNLNINGQSVTAVNGTAFEINLGANSTTTSVATSATGNNKNATGTVSFTNLVYTVTYELPVESVLNLYFGSTVISNVYVGGTKIIRVCIGDNVIYEV